MLNRTLLAKEQFNSGTVSVKELHHHQH